MFREHSVTMAMSGKCLNRILSCLSQTTGNAPCPISSSAFSKSFPPGHLSGVLSTHKSNCMQTYGTWDQVLKPCISEMCRRIMCSGQLLHKCK